MSKIFVISDLWFNRPNPNEQNSNNVEYNDDIVTKWNDTVQKNDTVYILGGLGIADLYHIVLRLNGKIHFLNNYYNDDEKRFFNEMKECIVNSCDPTLIDKYIFEDNQIVVLNEQDAVLSYFPISDWPGKESGTFCFHGFNNSIEIDNRNISCISSAWENTPVCIKDVQKNIDVIKSRM